MIQLERPYVMDTVVWLANTRLSTSLLNLRARKASIRVTQSDKHARWNTSLRSHVRVPK